MTGSIEAMFLAVVAFVGGHFILGLPNVRAALVERTGESGFKGLFTIVAGATFIWMILAYANAPYLEIWGQEPWHRWVPNLTLPISTILLVTSSTISNPTAVGQARVIEEHPKPARGIITVTRHPGLWGIGLWALSHMIANGDAAGILLFGGIAVLSFGGMTAIDAKRRAGLGAAWGPFEMTTSTVPFVAILQKRTQFDWDGIGFMRIAGGLVVWAVLWLAHPYFIGVSPAVF